MIGNFIIGKNESQNERDIYADKSALVLEWLLKRGIEIPEFSIRRVCKETKVSLGLVQRIFEVLVTKGFLKTEGVRTAKRFSLSHPKALLDDWVRHYAVTKKCKIRTYSSAFNDRKELVEALQKGGMSSKVILALHSAVEALGYKNTNLNTLELYMLDPTDREGIEEVLQLVPQDRGYQVLLIEPFYKSFLKSEKKAGCEIAVCSAFLAFLDLYNFPMRGLEQAEFMAERDLEIKKIYRHAARR
jgi:hypothetical protein